MKWYDYICRGNPLWLPKIIKDRHRGLSLLIGFLFVLVLSFCAHAQEDKDTITINTFFPPPYGLYKDLYFTEKLARQENIEEMLGGNANTHINLGKNSITGMVGQNNSYCTVSGGTNNYANGQYSVVGGGGYNTAGVESSTVKGGDHNIIWARHAAIIGGKLNRIEQDTGIYSTVLGGENNYADSEVTVIGGGGALGNGIGNQATSNYAAILGGSGNLIGVLFGGVRYNGETATILGGSGNNASSSCATIIGGSSNKTIDILQGADPLTLQQGSNSVVFGGLSNIAQGSDSIILGGIGNIIDSTDSFIGGGGAPDNQHPDESNEIHASCSVILGGRDNAINNFSPVASGNTSVVLGGLRNQTNNMYSVIVGGGGSLDNLDKKNIIYSPWSVIGGGYNNTVGRLNDLNRHHSVVIGGADNVCEGDYAFVGGRRAKLLYGNSNFYYDGSFVWADSLDEDYVPFISPSQEAQINGAVNQFYVRASGGAWFDTASTVMPAVVIVRAADHDADNRAETSLNLFTRTAGEGNKGFSFRFVNSANKLGLYRIGKNGSSLLMVFHADGGVRLGSDVDPFRDNVAPYKLEILGTLTCDRIAGASDIRLKTNITPLGNILDKFNQINPVRFEWANDFRSTFNIKDMDGQKLGVIGQEVEKLFPELVYTGNMLGVTDLRSVNYDGLTVLSLEAIKELNNELKNIEPSELNFNGIAQLKNGIAEISLPSSMNKIYNYAINLTAIDSNCPLFIKSTIQDGKFIVATTESGNSSQRFYWEVVGKK